MAYRLKGAPFGILILALLALSPHLEAVPCPTASQGAVYLLRGVLKYQNYDVDEEDLFIPGELKDAFWKLCEPNPNFVLSKMSHSCKEAFAECQDWTISRVMLQAIADCTQITNCDDYNGNPPLPSIFICTYPVAKEILTKDWLVAKPELKAKVQQACTRLFEYEEQKKPQGFYKAITPPPIPSSR